MALPLMEYWTVIEVFAGVEVVTVKTAVPPLRMLLGATESDTARFEGVGVGVGVGVGLGVGVGVAVGVGVGVAVGEGVGVGVGEVAAP
jgi:hypothetical protein